jgi:hypothetical protein
MPIQNLIEFLHFVIVYKWIILMLSFNIQYKGEATIICTCYECHDILPPDYNLFSLSRKTISFISSSTFFPLPLLYIHLPFPSSFLLLYFKNCLDKYHSKDCIIIEVTKVCIQHYLYDTEENKLFPGSMCSMSTKDNKHA